MPGLMPGHGAAVTAWLTNVTSAQLTPSIRAALWYHSPSPVKPKAPGSQSTFLNSTLRNRTAITSLSVSRLSASVSYQSWLGPATIRFSMRSV